MKPGPDIVISCPKCKQYSLRKTLMSGNTFNVTVWSDGRKKAPMFPEFPAIARCSGCGVFFWVDTAKECYRCRSGEIMPAEYAKATPAGFLSLNEYHDAITSGISRNEEDEFYLRCRQWWLFNDYYREGRSGEISSEMEAVNAGNLNRLLVILNDKDDSNRIMIAEILRYREEFEKSREIIESISSEKLKTVCEKILVAIDSRQKGPVLLFGAK